MPKMEQAVRTKKPSVSEWVKRAHAEEREAELSTIADPVQRRCREVELDLLQSKREIEILEGDAQ